MAVAWHRPCSTRPLRQPRTSGTFDLGGELYPFPGGDMTPSDVLKLIKEKQAKFADLRFTDTRGKEQHVTIPARLVDEEFFRDGKMFDGSSIAGWKGINESRSEEHTSELQSHLNLVCRLLLEKKK